MPRALKKVVDLIKGSGKHPDPILKSANNTCDTNRPLQKISVRELMQAESEIGARLFGPIPYGHQRSFFNVNETTWIWYESWKDPITREEHSLTTKYEITPEKIIKTQGQAKYEEVVGEEFENLIVAIDLYYEAVCRGLYKKPKAFSIIH